MDILNATLTPEERLWAEGWCKTNTYIIAMLTTPEFTEQRLAKLIKYEIEHQGREDLLFRMTARYNKLRRKREWETIIGLVRRKRAIETRIRKENRTLFGGASGSPGGSSV